ncbi:hypothetical protein N7475_000701 [Penicillium sp. IBT 31633x]|nr:hypothetical protein N7475_000701 [Penicillium sp. IBT 31633x]
MDLQGTPIPPGSHSTKVTTDPAAKQPIQESSGPVTNDSLAAESVRQSGAFSGNRGAEPMGVSSDQSTVNNTNTSASIKLPSAPTSSLRQDRLAETKPKYPEALSGQGNFPGTHLSNSGYSGGSTAAKKEMGITAGEYSSASGSGRSAQQGGGSSEAQNPSFTSDIGSEEDPGREAVNQFQHKNARTAYDTGRNDQKGVGSPTPYEHLESEQRV